MSWERPTLNELVERATSEMAGRLGLTGLNSRSVEAVLCRVEAGGLHLQYGFLEWLTGQVFPDTAESEFLDRWANIWDVARKAASYAALTVRLSGTDGTSIPAGTEMQDASGNLYATDGAVVVSGGVADAAATPSAAGTSGNLDAGTPLALLSPIAGVSGATVLSLDVDGADEETDADLRARVLARIQLPPHGGAAHDYVGWALEVPGVTRAWCTPLAYGLGTVGVMIVSDEAEGGPLPDAATLAAAQAYIDSVRPVTAAVTVTAPQALAVDITLSITPNTAAVKAAAAAELAALFERSAEPGAVIPLSHLNEAVSIAAGETDHVITSPAADIVPEADEMPMLGTITWS